MNHGYSVKFTKVTKYTKHCVCFEMRNGNQSNTGVVPPKKIGLPVPHIKTSIFLHEGGSNFMC